MLVTDRIAPLVVAGPDRAPGRPAVPLGQRGLSAGDSANDLLRHRARSQRAHPGGESGHVRHLARPPPARAALLELVAEYRRRAGIDAPMSTTRQTPRPGGVGRASRAGRLLHRHHAVHRVQGVRGRVQGVEQRARRRARLPRQLLRQHRQLGADTWRHVAFIEQRVQVGPETVPALPSVTVDANTSLPFAGPPEAATASAG